MFTPSCRTFISTDCTGLSPRKATPLEGKPLLAVSVMLAPGAREKSCRDTSWAVFMAKLSTSMVSVFFPAKISAPRTSGSAPVVARGGAARAVTITGWSSEAAPSAARGDSTTASVTALSRTCTLRRRVANESRAKLTTYESARTLANANRPRASEVSARISPRRDQALSVTSTPARGRPAVSRTSPDTSPGLATDAVGIDSYPSCAHAARGWIAHIASIATSTRDRCHGPQRGTRSLIS